MVQYVNDYTALLSGGSWWSGSTMRKPVFLTYSFETKPYAYLSDFGMSEAFIRSFKPFNSLEKSAALNALKQWDDSSGIVFLPAPAGQGDIRFANYDLDYDADVSDAAAYAYYPGTVIGRTYAYTPDHGGDVYVNTSSMSYSASDMTHLLAHEIGHAIGLKHSFEGDIRLEAARENTDYTVMSYTGYAPKLGPLDHLAVQALYGTDVSDGNQVSSWSWNARTATLTQKGGERGDTIRGVTSADVISGARGNDILFGAGGSDLIDGGAGNDVQFGGDDNDTLFGGAGTDALHGGSGYGSDTDGIDTVDYGAMSRSVTISLEGLSETVNGRFNYYNAKGGEIGRDTFSSIENVVGGGGSDTITGDADANVLRAGSGSDVVDGGSSNDWLYGGLGRDQLTGGEGADHFVFDTRLGLSNVKTVTDFTARRDKIVLDQDMFSGLKKTGLLSSSEFFAGTAAHDANDHVIYDTNNGKLFYDPDGVGGHGRIMIAALDAGLILNGSDFLVIA